MRYAASPDVSLVEIDTNHLEGIEDNPEAIEFGVRLSGRPTDIWMQEFEQAYHQTPYTLKPPVRIDGDTLRIIFLHRYAGELQGFIHFLAMMVDQANTETHRTEHLHQSSAQERYKAEFREALRQVHLTEQATPPRKAFTQA